MDRTSPIAAAPAGPARPPGRRRTRRRLAALALGLLLGFLACELAVRAWIGSPLVERPPLLVVRGNPHRGWEMMPSEPHYTYLHRVQVNALGLRGDEVPEAKAPGEVRVLALGDSLTYGQGVADPNTVPAWLEAELSARAPERDWRVVNGGLRGYSTRQELGLLRELGARIAPDVVVLLWYWNDIEPMDVERIHARLTESGPVVFDISARFEGWPALRWYGKQVLRMCALLMYAHELRKTGYGPHPTELVERGFERLERELDEYLELCAALGAEPLFAIIPDVGSLGRDHWTEPLNERAAALAAERGLPVIHLAPALLPLLERSRRPPILPYDGHYDPAANQAMAEALAPAVLAASPP